MLHVGRGRRSCRGNAAVPSDRKQRQPCSSPMPSRQPYSHARTHVTLSVDVRRSGADKVSIGGDAVDAAEEYFRLGKPTGRSSIEQISWHYGAQAVVVSIDPRRVWVADPADCPHATVRSSRTGALQECSAVAQPRGVRHVTIPLMHSADLMS